MTDSPRPTGTPLINAGGKSSNHPRTIERHRAAQGRIDSTYDAHDYKTRREAAPYLFTIPYYPFPFSPHPLWNVEK